MTAFDEFDDEDSTEFIQVRQVITGSENYFNIDQQGSGVIPPAQYTYEYSVEDLAGNVATETVLINVVMRKFMLYTGVVLDTADYDNATYVDEFKEEVATQYGRRRARRRTSSSAASATSSFPTASTTPHRRKDHVRR